jgi:hypothetical protein
VVLAEEESKSAYENNNVEIPKKLIDLIKNVVTVSLGSDGYHRLNLPSDMTTRMNGNCEYREMFESVDNSNAWQCNSRPHFMRIFLQLTTMATKNQIAI